MPYGNWFDALGNPVSQEGRAAACEWLVGEGLDPMEVDMVVAVVAREIEHDEPDRAQRYMRSLCDNRVDVATRAIAILCTTGLERPEVAMPYGMLVKRNEASGPCGVIGKPERSMAGNICLRVGRVLAPMGGASGWTQTEHVVLTPDEACALAAEIVKSRLDPRGARSTS